MTQRLFTSATGWAESNAADKDEIKKICEKNIKMNEGQDTM